MWHNTTVIEGKLIIYIASGIEVGLEAKALLDQVEASTGPIELLVNSDGGSLTAADALRKTLDATKRVTRAVILKAKSAAWVAMMAAPRIEMVSGAIAMIHVGTVGLYGNAKDFRACADSLAECDLDLCRLLHERRKIPIELAASWFDGRDHVFDTTEAKRIGLVDDIVSPRAQWPGEPPVNAPGPLEDAERAGELFRYLRGMAPLHLMDPAQFRSNVNWQLDRIIL